MNVFLFFCLFHNIVYLFPHCLSYELFVITRKSGTSRRPGDVFTVPNNYCPDNIPQCEVFRALPSSEKNKSCRCVCGADLKPSTTLGFQNGSFRCIENSLFRTNEGCDNPYLFPGETLSHGLRVLSSMDHTVSLGAANSHGVEFSIDIKTSYLYECNGTWNPIKNLSMKFEILKVLNSADRSWIYHLMIKKSSSPYLDGRIIKLGLDYSNTKGKHKGCLLFKLAGTIKCRGETNVLLPVANEPTVKSLADRTAGEKLKSDEKIKSHSFPVLMMESYSARTTRSKSYGQHKRLGYSISFSFLVVGVILSAVILIGVPFMCCRKGRRKYVVKNKKVGNKEADGNSEDQDLVAKEQQWSGDGRSRAFQSKSLGDLSLYDNYMPPQFKVSLVDNQHLKVNETDDLLPSDSESYPDYHVLEGPDPNAPSPPPNTPTK